jgi:hypothetical protein
MASWWGSTSPWRYGEWSSANFQIPKFHAVLERKTISKTTLEKGFSYNMSCFYSFGVFVSKN